MSRGRTSYGKEQEELINFYEAEEERITNVLLVKLEKLRQDKIDLENTLEAESESHVNRLTRELSLLKAAQMNGHHGEPPTSTTSSANRSPSDPSMEVMLETLRLENEQLRTRLQSFERDYIRLSRLNEIYREELIEHRTRLGRSVDNLVGISSVDPYTQSAHRRTSSSLSSRTSSPSTSLQYPVPQLPRPIPSVPVPIPNGVPIPRPPSQVHVHHHRPVNIISSESNTPLSHSPTLSSAESSASESPYTFSPNGLSSMSSTNPASFVTTPPSSASMAIHSPVLYGVGGAARGLSYPSVPPPSLSSSFGSPSVSFYMGQRDWDRDVSLSPVEPLTLNSRRGSIANGQRRGSESWRVAETGSLRNSRRESIERGNGARVVETGSLVPRGRAPSQSQNQTSLPRTIGEALNDVEES